MVVVDGETLRETGDEVMLLCVNPSDQLIDQGEVPDRVAVRVALLPAAMGSGSLRLMDSGVMETDFDPLAELPQLAVTVTPMLTLPEQPARKVIALVPAPLVIVPPLIDQE